MNEYPTEEQLAQLRAMSLATGAAHYDWLCAAKALWNCHYGRVTRGFGYWRFATGGWSGNEDIIDAMIENSLAWVVTWHKSERGGLYVFYAPASDSAKGE